MNRRELNFIRKTAEGIDEALKQLHGPEPEKHLINALVDMGKDLEGPITSKAVGYYAMMLIASEDYRSFR